MRVGVLIVCYHCVGIEVVVQLGWFWDWVKLKVRVRYEGFGCGLQGLGFGLCYS